MKQVIATVTSKGQITVPAEVRETLGLEAGAKLIFAIDDEGNIFLRKPRFPDVRSLAGAAGSLKQPMSWKEMLATAYEDRFTQARSEAHA